jgi:hypothetical protein
MGESVANDREWIQGAQRTISVAQNRIRKLFDLAHDRLDDVERLERRVEALEAALRSITDDSRREHVVGAGGKCLFCDVMLPEIPGGRWNTSGRCPKRRL